MSNFSLQAAEVLQSFEGTEFKMIELMITISDGKFPIRSTPEQVTVTDGVTSVESFMAFITPDQKRLHSYFTTDGLNVFPGTVSVHFGTMGDQANTLETIDLGAVMETLPAFLASAGAPNADEAWLASI